MESTPNTPQLPENEIRVSFKTDVKSAVERIEKAFENFDHVKLSGINSGISKLIVILEITKVKCSGLHQINLVETLTSKADDGSDRLRYSTAYRAELHKQKPKTVPTGYFYQAPYTSEHVEAIKAVKVDTENREERPRGGMRGGRGRGRGGRGRGRGFRGGNRGGFRGDNREGNVEESQGELGFRGGRGRGRGFRGGNRGGFRGDNREGTRGGFRGDNREGTRGGFRGDNREGTRGGFRGENRDGNRGEFQGERGSRGGRGAPRGGRGGSRGGDAPQSRPQTAAPAQSRGIPGLRK